MMKTGCLATTQYCAITGLETIWAIVCDFPQCASNFGCIALRCFTHGDVTFRGTSDLEFKSQSPGPFQLWTDLASRLPAS
ncbi:hypothetical protein RRSWK_01300 [Rhodopirellula sp. SWK7]|nr:hypothetical protein RRSWK_01300 [Rhodopirellula sp. SWK7]